MLEERACAPLVLPAVLLAVCTRRRSAIASVASTYHSTSNEECIKSSWFIPCGSTDKLRNKIVSAAESVKPLIVGVLGDSVASGAGAREGFVKILEKRLLDITQVEVRNYAKGATGPRYTFFCNDVRGDEDVIVVETVRPGEEADLEHLTSSLLCQHNSAVILVLWGRGANITKFRRVARALNVPLLDARACLVQGHGPVDFEQSFADDVHPNQFGHMHIANQLEYMFLHELSLRRSHKVPQTCEKRTKSIVSAGECKKDFALLGELSTCYTLNCSQFSLKPCLRAYPHGFELKSIEEKGNSSKRKIWWEGNRPGDFIIFNLTIPCRRVVLFINKQSERFGDISVEIDGRSLGNISGYSNQFTWIPKSRSMLVDVEIASNLPLKLHLVKVKVLSETRAQDGGHKFDIVGLSTSTV